MSSKATSDYRKRRKQNLLKICGEKCAICGYNKCIGALEFHHLKPEEKLFSIAAHGTCHDLEADIQEIKKCILVCSNCHREIHDNQYSLKDLLQLQFFDEEIIEQLREAKKELFNKTKYFCSQCNKEITRYSKTGLCETCYHTASRISERPSREELKDLIRNKPFTQIGQMFKVSDNTIRKWCKAENLPTKKNEIIKITESEWSKI